MDDGAMANNKAICFSCTPIQQSKKTIKSNVKMLLEYLQISNQCRGRTIVKEKWSYSSLSSP